MTTGVVVNRLNITILGVVLPEIASQVENKKLYWIGGTVMKHTLYLHES